MLTAGRQIEVFLERRGQLLLECLVATAAGAGLFAVAPAIGGHGSPDQRALFVCVCLLFGVCSAALVARLIPTFLYRCPRCRELFHGELPRALFALGGLRRRCGHCGMGPARRTGSETPAA